MFVVIIESPVIVPVNDYSLSLPQSSVVGMTDRVSLMACIYMLLMCMYIHVLMYLVIRVLMRDEKK